MVQDIEHTDVPAAPSSDASWRSDVLRRLRLEEFLFLVMFIPSMIVTIWANFDLCAEGIRSRRIRGGILRLVIVAALGAVLRLLDRWRRHLSPSVGRSTIEFFRTFLPFALCSAVYTNLHDTVRWINPNDIHDRLMVIEEWMFGFQPVVWAEQFITPERTEFFSFLYANFFVLTIVVSCVLWALGRRRDARDTMLGIIVCFYSGYVLYVVFPAAPPRLYFESLGMFSVDLSGGPITEVLTVHATKPVCSLKMTVTRTDGEVVLDGEDWWRRSSSSGESDSLLLARPRRSRRSGERPTVSQLF